MCRRCRATGVLIVPTPPKNSHRCTPLTAPAGVAKMKCSPTAASEAAAAAAAASATRPWDSAVTRATQQRRRCYRSSPCSQSTGSAVSPLAALNFICWSELLPLLPLQSHGANGGGRRVRWLHPPSQFSISFATAESVFVSVALRSRQSRRQFI